MRPEEYVDLGVKAIVGILQQERAAVWSEIEARAAEFPWADLPRPVDPNHLTTARRLLVEAGEVVQEAAPTRGGRVVETLHLAGSPTRERELAAARKRLVMARFLGWSKGTKRHPRGLIGPAGEEVTAESLMAAAPAAGYRVVPRDGNDVKQLLNMEVPGGPLDSAAHLIAMEGDSPQGVITVPIEVKNLRDWLYPWSTEPYQLLAKAAALQVARPNAAIAPVLVCRRAHLMLFRMAKGMGFYVIDARRQFILPSADVSQESLSEVRTELGFTDLVTHEGPHSWVTPHFESHFPKVAARTAEMWAETAPRLADHFKTLRKSMDDSSRRALLDHLRTIEKRELGGVGGW